MAYEAAPRPPPPRLTLLLAVDVSNTRQHPPQLAGAQHTHSATPAVLSAGSATNQEVGLQLARCRSPLVGPETRSHTPDCPLSRLPRALGSSAKGFKTGDLLGGVPRLARPRTQGMAPSAAGSRTGDSITQQQRACMHACVRTCLIKWGVIFVCWNLEPNITACLTSAERCDPRNTHVSGGRAVAK